MDASGSDGYSLSSLFHCSIASGKAPLFWALAASAKISLAFSCRFSLSVSWAVLESLGLPAGGTGLAGELLDGVPPCCPNAIGRPTAGVKKSPVAKQAANNRRAASRFFIVIPVVTLKSAVFDIQKLIKVRVRCWPNQVCSLP